MKFWVGVTDDEWHEHLSSLKPDELNFWKPSPRSSFTALHPGEFFLFKLHSPRNYIVGGGVFSSYSVLPISMAWDHFGEKNGAPSYEIMRAQILGHRKDKIGEFEDFDIGCNILTQPFFFPEEDWFPVPEWSRQIVPGKTYTLETPGGRQIWKDLSSALQKYREFGLDQDVRRIEEESPRYGRETLVHPRLGQGAFKVAVTNAYSRSCAISEEHALPALEAAHIKPYGLHGPHQVRNGLLLRSDIHRLFDRGYITVTPDYHVEVSQRLKDDYRNGRYYYPFNGTSLSNLPRNPTDSPSKEFLHWHNDNVFK